MSDIERSVEFYQRALGMVRIDFAAGRVALSFGRQKINLHRAGKEFEPKAANVSAGSADRCFILDTPVDDAVVHLRRSGIETIEGPVERTGANGSIVSVCFRNPDGNLIEVSNTLE